MSPMDVRPRKVTARVDLIPANHRSRPASPTKNPPSASPSPSSFRPRAKPSPDATVSPLYSFQTTHAPPARSRPGSPFKPSRVLPNGSEPGSSPIARVTARPTSRSGTSPVQPHPNSLESRQRALTAASPKLRLPLSEDRPRSGSVVALHRALSVSDISSPASPTLPPPSPSVQPPLVDTGRTNTPPAPAPIKIKSKLTGLAKAASTHPADAASRSLSPPYATTRPIQARARSPSITTSFSLNDPPSSVFYPITTSSPAANPHRYAPSRARSPARSYPSPPPSSETHPARRPALVPKADPASVPLPPHSPPMSALSLSSKSSVSRTSLPPTDHTNGSHAVSHTKRGSQSNPFVSPAETRAQTKRDRSRSTERSLRNLAHRDESDPESDGSERQLRAEAKTNRKIADLEITNRSLLAINASLETTKNRQAKEIRDLRRKLRESRLILPPRTYKAVKSALEDERDRNDDEGDGDGDGDDDDSDVEEAGDETFQRVRSLIDSLMESGKRALETGPEDFRASLATKVLNADELRSWRDSGQHPLVRNNYVDGHDADDKTIQGLLPPLLIPTPGSDSSSSAESDGELALDSQGSSALPPITITHSL